MRYILYIYICFIVLGAPQIDVPPEYTDIVKLKAGVAVKLKLGISGKPLPAIEWFKNGKEMQTSAQVSFENTSEFSSVLIKDASRINSGLYELKLKNAMGSASASIRVQMLGKLSFFILLFLLYMCSNIVSTVYLNMRI